MSPESSFRAFRIDQPNGQHRAGLEDIRLDQLNEGEVTIRVAYSSVNYKDALAGTGQGKILRQFPLVGGIDVAGHVVASRDERFREGDRVLVTGSQLSETRDGGYADYARLEGRWVVPCPEALTLRDAMAIGTAGFTAALSLYRMEQVGLRPDAGPVVVTGATGGVGMLAVDLCAGQGYAVSAITGKEDAFDFLQSLGAAQCISRKGLHWGSRPLESAMFAGAIDNVGGDMLSGLTRVMQPWGAIASCGLTGGIGVSTTVMPFIIRGISLLGINSSGTPYPIREELWRRLAGPWRPRHLDRIASQEVELEGLPDAFRQLLEGRAFGRIVVRVGGET